MELNLPENVTLDNAIEQAHSYWGALGAFKAASLYEIACLIAIPLLSLLIGTALNRYIDRRPNKTLGFAVMDFCAPLVSSVLTVLLSVVALQLFHHFEIQTYILPFGLKLAIAWFAIQLVMLMSSHRSAGWLIACFIMPITLLHLFDLWGITTQILSDISFKLGSVEVSLYLILKGITVIFILHWLASFSVRMTDMRLRRITSMRASNRTLIIKIFQILIYCMIFMVGMQMLGINLTALSIFSGALGVGLGFGLQKIASNFISGIILLFEKSIEVGDMIELADGTIGTIRLTQARYTLIETFDGRDIMIPNEEFISQRVTSWTHSSLEARTEIQVSVGYESDIELAQKLMIEAAKSHPKCHPSRAPMCVMNAFGDSGIALQLFFWVANVTDGRMEPRSDVMLAILKAFKANNISIPYPQRETRILNMPVPLKEENTP